MKILTLFMTFRIELVQNYQTLPFKNRPREKLKKDDIPDITTDPAFEPAVIYKMLNNVRSDMFPIEGRQEDAEEFLGWILNKMNDEMIEVNFWEKKFYNNI